MAWKVLLRLERCVEALEGLGLWLTYRQLPLVASQSIYEVTGPGGPGLCIRASIFYPTTILPPSRHTSIQGVITDTQPCAATPSPTPPGLAAAINSVQSGRPLGREPRAPQGMLWAHMY